MPLGRKKHEERKKHGFLGKLIFNARRWGKNRIKNYRGDHYEFRDFW
jgi:hypothetical protein